MAARKPLVLVSGIEAEIPSADVLSPPSIDTGRIDASNVISVSGGSGFTAGARLHIYYSGGSFFDSYNSTTATYNPITFSGSDLNFRIGITSAFRVNNTFGNYANDAAAAVGGVPVGYLYRNGSVLMIRVT